MELFIFIGVIFLVWHLFGGRKNRDIISTKNKHSDNKSTAPLRYRNLTLKEQAHFRKHKNDYQKNTDLKTGSSLPSKKGLETQEKILEKNTNSSPISSNSAEIDPLIWFEDFEHFISECVKISNSNAEIRSELEANARLNRIYLQMKSEQERRMIKQKSDEKMELRNNSSVDSEKFRRNLLNYFPQNSVQTSLADDQYAQALKNHEKFISSTVSKIKSQNLGASEFEALLQNVGMQEILERHFPTLYGADDDLPKHLINESGQLPPIFMPNISRHFEVVKKEGPPFTSIKDISKRRGISRLVHFTRVENLNSIVTKGIKPVSVLESESISFIRNDQKRLDRHLDAISISISFPNFRTFYKMRMENTQREWAVLLLKPEVLWEKECGFFPLNAASSAMRSRNLDQLKDSSGFEEMFSMNYGDREHFLGDCDPTNSQAEVMVFDAIEPDFIDAIAFETFSSADNFETYQMRLAFGDIDRQKSIKTIKQIKVLDRASSAKFFGTREKFYSPF